MDLHANLSAGEAALDAYREDECARVLAAQGGPPPRAALILGTGLGDAVRAIASPACVPFTDLPGFPHSTATGHRGRFVLGRLENVPVIAMDGRCHLYEGYSARDVTLGVRLMRRLGVETLILTNASGGLDPRLRSGDIVVLESHINLLGKRGLPQPTLAAGAPSGPTPYCPQLAELALATARAHDFHAVRGSYVATLGPNYETRSEYRFMRRLGGTVVGMSTVPEVLAAAQLGQRVLALSVVTNVARPDAPTKTTGEEVVQLAARAAENLLTILRAVVGQA